MSVVIVIVAALGSLLLVISAAGLFRLPDPLTRQHAATKSTTLALWMVLFAAALTGEDLGWWLRVALIIGILLVTLPIASHMLARAAARESYSEHEVIESRCGDMER